MVNCSHQGRQFSPHPVGTVSTHSEYNSPWKSLSVFLIIIRSQSRVSPFSRICDCAEAGSAAMVQEDIYTIFIFDIS